MSIPVHGDYRISVFHVATSTYASLKIERRHYPHWIASHVLQGSVHTTLEGAPVIARAGDVMIHPANLPFDEIAHRAGVHQWILFEAQTEVGLDLFNVYPVGDVVTLTDAKAYVAVFESLRQAWESGAQWRDVAVTTLTMQLLVMVLQSGLTAPSRRVSTLPSQRFAHIIRHMIERLSSPITRAQLATMAHLHPTHFDRAFRAVHGRSPMQLLRELRLQRARQLVEAGDMTLNQVAETCGLRDATYLNRVFRKRFGASPGQHRSRVKSASASYLDELTR